MALIETKIVDQITVIGDGAIFYREATTVSRDGVEIAKSYHRSSLTPGQDLTGVPANVAAICTVAWTQEVIDAYNAQIAANALPQG
jgi:hypothetical protein